MNEQLFYMQYLGFFQAEWSAIIALLVAGTLYFLAPAVGYAASKRGTLLASLWAMIGKLGIGIVRQALVSLQFHLGGGIGMPSRSSAGGLFGAFDEIVPVLLSLAETIVFLAAIILFVFGLQRLERREPPPFQTQQSPEH